MIAKINSGTSVFSALSYNMNKVEDKNASVIHTNNMIEDTHSGSVISMRNALLSFESYLLANRKTKKPVLHVSINPSPEDKLSGKKLIDLANDYMEKMGYADQPYIVFKHNDIEREHIHIVSLKIDKEGKKINDRYEKIRSMKACRDLEIKYGLKQITDEKDENVHLFVKPIDYRKGDIKRQMSNIIRSVIDNYDFQSIGEYNAILSCFNIQSKYIKGESKDNLYHGIVYSTTDNEGNYIGNRIKSSRIGKFCGYTELTRSMLKTKETIKKDSAPYKARNIIAKAKSESGSKNEFIDKLKNNNIDVLWRVNEKGKLYGITFIDHAERIAFNGSRIGKEFSANAINDWLKKLDSNSKEGMISKENSLASDTVHYQERITDSGYYPEHPLPTGGRVTAGTPDPEEEEFIRRMKRKKKGKRRL
ncbi:conjugal transfer protein MobB [Dysgonomonas sp. UBA7698]|uniref:conjugal transfer protein MobB n=1 Tax=Dysgonomonas sp. UBA7698 TaxID=1946427 RepID=UPI0025C6FE97|nr:conjugal transfer protein MobB [Dysgonomonas sp. UBA7698]